MLPSRIPEKDVTFVAHILRDLSKKRKKLTCLCPRPNAKHETNQFVPFTLHVAAYNVCSNNLYQVNNYSLLM